MISLIVAKAQNNVIGSRNDLPWYLPADLRRFKELTTGHTVVMGRKTLESILARLGHPLPDRRNIVLTRQQVSYPDVEALHDLREIERLDDDVFIIGGAEVYAQTISMADRLYVTEVKAEINGDAHFPDIDRGTWQEMTREPHFKDDKNQYDYDFVVYARS